MSLQTLISSRRRFTGELGRAADVAAALVKYGLAGWLADINWKPVHDALKSHGGEVLSDLPFEARVRLVLTDLGTTFIKLGQTLSTRPDIVGQPLADELSKLQRHTPPDPPDVALRIVEEELGCPVSFRFRSFNAEAFESASIGQVHHATLRDGTPVVVKVRHPGIEEVIRRDLDILHFLAEIAAKNSTLKHFEPVGVIREFEHSILNELDFRRELRHLQAFRRNFAEDDTVAFPRPYEELSGARVLTMDRFDGYRGGDNDRELAVDVDRNTLAQRGAAVFIQMIFRDGFYHADPHPGNFIVLPDGKIGLIDAGMVGHVDEQTRTQIEDILLAAAEQDTQRLTDNVLRITGRPVHLDIKRLTADLNEVVQDYGTQPVEEYDVGDMLNRCTDILHRYRLILPGRISKLVRCLVLLEGTARQLSPSFSLASLLAPWRNKLLKRRSTFRARYRRLRRSLGDWQRLMETVPRNINNAMDRMEEGHLVIRLEHRNLKSAVNRFLGGLFISALLLASALLISRNVPPRAWDVSIPGAAGYLVAIYFGIKLLWRFRDKANQDDD